MGKFEHTEDHKRTILFLEIVMVICFIASATLALFMVLVLM